MSFPAYFDTVAPLVLHDPLAEFLGAAQDGLLTVSYSDAVRMAGHSCPTLAGAWLMASRAMRELYGQDVPERGDILVQMREEAGDGVCGVIASVFSLITGAAAEGGFQGLAGHYNRRNLLSFGQKVEGLARFTRKDSGRAVTVDYDHAPVPADPTMMPLMQKSLQGQASPQEIARFRELWDNRIRSILLDHGDELVTARTLEG